MTELNRGSEGMSESPDDRNLSGNDPRDIERVFEIGQMVRVDIPGDDWDEWEGPVIGYVGSEYDVQFGSVGGLFKSHELRSAE